MRGFSLTTEYETYHNCWFRKGIYEADGSLFLEIWNDEEGPIAGLTRCLGGEKKKGNFSYLDMNNCPWAVNLVEQMGIAKDTGITERSGYCIYPLYEFDMDKVNEYVKEV